MILTQTRSKELGMLENLGHELIIAPADGSTLEAILAQHLPGLFPNDHLVVHLFAKLPDGKIPAWPTFSLPTALTGLPSQKPSGLMGSEAKSLASTGIPLGIFEGTEWEQAFDDITLMVVTRLQ